MWESTRDLIDVAESKSMDRPARKLAFITRRLLDGHVYSVGEWAQINQLLVLAPWLA